MGEKLQLTFLTEGNQSVSFTVLEPKDNLTDTQIKDAMDVMIQQGAISTKSGLLASKKGAKFVTTQEREVSLA